MSLLLKLIIINKIIEIAIMFKKVKKRNNQKVELDHTTDESTTVKAVEQSEIQDVEMAQPA